jgi:predicted DNA-binding protein
MPVKPAKPTKHKLGRSATGHDPRVSARIPQHLRDRLDAWARRRGIPRSLAIRRLLEGAIKLKS